MALYLSSRVNFTLANSALLAQDYRTQTIILTRNFSTLSEKILKRYMSETEQLAHLDFVMNSSLRTLGITDYVHRGSRLGSQVNEFYEIVGIIQSKKKEWTDEEYVRFLEYFMASQTVLNLESLKKQGIVYRRDI